jgi:hypothetical protein
MENILKNNFGVDMMITGGKCWKKGYKVQGGDRKLISIFTAVNHLNYFHNPACFLLVDQHLNIHPYLLKPRPAITETFGKTRSRLSIFPNNEEAEASKGKEKESGAEQDKIVKYD